MARSYRMTPARRAALRKAQLASARKRKRRRNIAIAAGGVGVLAGVGTAAYFGRSYLRRTIGGGPTKPKPVSKELVHVPGLGRTYDVIDLDKQRKRLKPKRAPKAHGHKVWKVDLGGEVSGTRFNADNSRARNRHNQQRRHAYWKAKPVAKVGYTIPRRKKRKK